MSQKINILIVDDSSVVRGLLTKALSTNDRFHIVDTASDGQMAVNMSKKYKPDFVILDIQMPIMGGLEALPIIKKESPETEVIVISAFGNMTMAQLTLEALNKGAADYIAKPTRENFPEFCNVLLKKMESLYESSREKGTPKRLDTVERSRPIDHFSLMQSCVPNSINAMAIAASTGGPRALMTLFEGLRGKINHIPVFITQHMQPTFTRIFSEQIQEQSGMPCIEGDNGIVVKPGHIYLAPGDYHLIPERQRNEVVLCVTQDPPVNFCRPAADPMFIALSKAYKENLMGVVMTGMGQDGAVGAQIISHAGGIIIAQDEDSSLVYGMPKAVADLGICDAVISLDEMAEYLAGRCNV